MSNYRINVRRIVERLVGGWNVVCALLFCCLVHFTLLGCGFHGFNARLLAKYMQAVRIESVSPFDEMNIELAKRFKTQDINVLIGSESPSEKAPKLSIETHFDYSTLSTMHSTTARIYTMRYTVNFSLEDNGRPIARNIAVVVEREILLQPNEMFEVTSQVGAVKREMCSQMARKIIQIIISRYEDQAGTAATPAAH